MVRIKKISIAIAGFACATIGSAVASSSAQALTITNNFRVDITTGSLANQSFFGEFRYDDASLTGSGVPLIDPSNGNQLINSTNGLLGLSFNFLGNTYTEQSDSGYPTFPQLNFKAGLFQGLDFVVEASPSVFIPNSTSLFGTGYDISSGDTFFLAFVGDPNAPSDVSEGIVSYGQPIPTPALLPGLVGLGISVLRKRRTEAKSAASV